MSIFYFYSLASLDFALQLLVFAQQLLTLELFLQLLDQQVKRFLYCLLCVHTCMCIEL